MIVLGLTGSIAMGKSSASTMLRRMGFPLHDADRTVHKLIGPGGKALDAIEALFPGVTGANGVDRSALGAKVFGDPGALAQLESIIHPLARAEALSFLRRMKRRRLKQELIAVLDIPLLFETKAERLCHAVMVVSAPAFLQEARALQRPGMTKEKFSAIRDRQMADREKRRRADFVVQTGLSKGHTLRQLKQIVRLLRENEIQDDGARRP
ncbi:MAG: dephospho-CoA kinase [Kiloniellales bacterium]|nr:dephospho-CoA kinase [Kiloniellales bacterium]